MKITEQESRIEKMKQRLGFLLLAGAISLAVALPASAQSGKIFIPLVVITGAQTDAADEPVPAEAALSENELIQRYVPQVDASAVIAVNGKIAFSSDADGDFDIYTMNPDGTGLVNLTNAMAGVGQDDPSWSPDGTKIAFTNVTLSEWGEVFRHIWVMNADGNNASQITQGGANDFALNKQPDWSPDGTKIAYTSEADDGDIYIMNADGTNPRNMFVTEPLFPYADLPPFEWPEWDPSWSSDGTKILYTASRPSGTEIATLDVTGDNPEVLLTTGLIADYSEAVWSPDGQLIAYTEYSYGGPYLWVMNADGSHQTAITPGNVLNLYLPAFSPDGSLLTFTAYPAELGSTSDLFSIPAPTAPLPPPAAVQAAATTATATRLTTIGGVTHADWQKKTVNTVPFYTASIGLRGGSGVILSQPSGINCGTQCKMAVAPRATITLTATPSAGSKFVTWAGACTGKTATCTVTVNKLRLAVAFFVKQK
jgi:Tol biopolymer transport system component